jgi:ribosomal protein L7/L12
MKTLNVAAFGALVSAFTEMLNNREYRSLDMGDCNRLEHLVLNAVETPELVQEAPKADPNLIKSLLWAIKDGRKIEAIKCHRMLTGYGLKESKDAIEAYWPDNSVEMRLRSFVSKLANDFTGANSLDDWRGSACAVLKEIEAR